MCLWKFVKRSVVGVAVLGLAGFLVFGKELTSYVRSSGRAVQEAVEDSVPFEFQIQRARHMLDELVPELHANIKQVAQEQVEVAALVAEIDRERTSVSEERTKIARLRESLSGDRTTIRLDRATYRREQVVEELGRRFKQFQTAEVLLASKEKLLENRRQALASALEKLDRMRVARVELEAQIESLEGQFRLVQAEAGTSKFRFDDSKLAQIHKVIGDLRKRLDVAQQVLSHEARFIENIPVETPDETSLLESIDAHLETAKPALEDDKASI
jgi:hypothetical protein